MTADEHATPAPLGSHRFFEPHRLRVDTVVMLFGVAQALAADAHSIVEVGCGRGVFVEQAGRGRPLHDLRGADRHVIGIDVDSTAARNPVVDEFRQIEDDNWPLASGSVDLVFCDWVLEHVTDPKAFIHELHRVLRPGGAFLARTVNRNSLLALGSRAIPNRRHARVVGSLQPARETQDVFPTSYLMNHVPALYMLLDKQFDWAASFHPGLEYYANRSHLAAAVAAAVEQRLPRKLQSILLVSARKH